MLALSAYGNEICPTLKVIWTDPAADPPCTLMYLMDALTDEVDVDRRNSAEWKHAVLNRCKMLERAVYRRSMSAHECSGEIVVHSKHRQAMEGGKWSTIHRTSAAADTERLTQPPCRQRRCCGCDCCQLKPQPVLQLHLVQRLTPIPHAQPLLLPTPHRVPFNNHIDPNPAECSRLLAPPLPQLPAPLLPLLPPWLPASACIAAAAGLSGEVGGGGSGRGCVVGLALGGRMGGVGCMSSSECASAPRTGRTG